MSLVLNVRRLCVVESVLRDFRMVLTGMWLRVPAIKTFLLRLGLLIEEVFI